MYLEITKPQSSLGAVVESVVYYSGYTASAPFESLLPDGYSQLIVALDDQPRGVVEAGVVRPLTGAWFTGVQTRPLCYLGERQATTVCIRFSPGGFFSRLGMPLQELQGRIVDAREILGPKVDALREEFAKAQSAADRERVFESIVPSGGTGEPENAHVTRFVLRELYAGRRTLGEIIDHTGYSWRHVIRIFKDHVGLSPKRFQRLLRFRRALADCVGQHDRSHDVPIMSDGYADESHRIREFRSFAGITPGDYLRAEKPYPHVLLVDELPAGR